MGGGGGGALEAVTFPLDLHKDTRGKIGEGGGGCSRGGHRPTRPAQRYTGEERERGGGVVLSRRSPSH